jgi:hypothetical protein
VTAVFMTPIAILRTAMHNHAGAETYTTAMPVASRPETIHSWGRNSWRGLWCARSVPIKMPRTNSGIGSRLCPASANLPCPASTPDFVVLPLIKDAYTPKLESAKESTYPLISARVAGSQIRAVPAIRDSDIKK